MTVHNSTGRRFGPRKDDSGRTEFRLWAPTCRSVALELAGNAPAPMTASDDGWYSLTVSAPIAAQYSFVIDGNLKVPDPASRFQPSGVHGPSMLSSDVPYAWRTSDWHGRPWSEAVIYELHAGVFGGYRGVQDRLDELAALGITAIELMPVATFGGSRNWGYDGVLPFAPHPAYGTPDDLRALIDAAHARGLMVLLDVVYNHFGPDGNFLAEYADRFFDDATNSPWGRGIAFADENVAAFFHENALMWLEDYRIDGLRIDAAWAIGDRNWFVNLKRLVDERIAPSRHVHLILENENNDAGLLRDGYDAQWNDDFHNAMHVVLSGEHEGYYAQYAEEPLTALMKTLADGFYYQGQIPPGERKPRGQDSSTLPKTCFVNFLQNHDQIGNRAFGERLTDLLDDDTLHAAYATLLLAPAIPMLFMGDEWGSRTPFLFFTDYSGELGKAVVDGRRREFAKFSSFKDESKRARIADPNHEDTFRRSIPDRAERDTARGKAWLTLTQSLLALRRQYVTPHLAEARTLAVLPLAPKALHATWRLGSTTLGIALNLGADAADLPLIKRDSVIFTTSESSAWDEKGQISLPPRSVTVFVSDEIAA